MHAVATGSLLRLYYVIRKMPEYVSTARLADLKQARNAIRSHKGGMFLIAQGDLQFYSAGLTPHEAIRILHLCLIKVFGMFDLEHTTLEGAHYVQTAHATLNDPLAPQARPHGLPAAPSPVRRQRPRRLRTLDGFLNRTARSTHPERKHPTPAFMPRIRTLPAAG